MSFSSPGAGAVVYETLGTGTSRRFIIQWNNVTALNSPGYLDFEVILFEQGSILVFQYDRIETVSSAVSNGASATVGIRDTDGVAFGRNLQWSYNAPVLANGLAIKITPPASVPPEDITRKFKVTTGGLLYNRLTRTYTGTVTLLNTSGIPVDRPLTLLATGLSPEVTAVNASGSTAEGPYWLVPGTEPVSAGSTISVPVVFRNPRNARIAVSTKVFSGSF